jgi:hypothetical protein
MHFVTDIVAVRDARGRAGISRDKNPFVFGDDATRPSSVARRSLADNVCNFHKIFIPRRSLMSLGFCHTKSISLFGKRKSGAHLMRAA